MATKIKRIKTRFPNLEVGFFAGLLVYLERMRVNLGITTGELEWVFVSTASEAEPEDEETICFNAGGGKYDQHGHPDNSLLGRVCSIDLVRGDYDFVRQRPWLREIYQLISANDVMGLRISRHPFNLRELLWGLTVTRADDPKLVLDWLTLAFCGVFNNLKEGISVKKVFEPEQLSKGVAAYVSDSSQWSWFSELLDEAIVAIKRQVSWAKAAIKAAEDYDRVREVYVPSIDATVKVIEVRCDSVKTAPMARQAGYQLVIQWNKDGHCQIHGGTIKSGEIRKQVDLGVVAQQIRFFEAKFRHTSMASGQNWQGSGFVVFENESNNPWYLPEFRTSLYNGTVSSKDVEPTRIMPNKLLEMVVAALPKCDGIVREGNSGERDFVRAPLQ